MLRKSSIILCMLMCSYVSSYALDIDLPGADSSISSNAYEDYNFSNMRVDWGLRAYNKTIQAEIDAEFPNESAEWKDKIRRIRLERIRADLFHSTVVLLHNKNGGGIRFSVPIDSRIGTSINKEDLETLHIEGSQATLDVTVHNNLPFKEDITINSRDIVKDDFISTFSYPTMNDSVYRNFKKIIDGGPNDSSIKSIKFKSKDDSQRSYQIDLTYSVEKNERFLVTGGDVNRMLVNYVIPSVQPLSDLDAYTDTKHDKNWFYKVPKGLTGTSFTSQVDYFGQYIVRYEADGYLQEITINKITGEERDKTRYSSILRSFEDESKAYILGQYAIVWNNGVPAVLMDKYNPKGESIMVLGTYDGDLEYRNYIKYNPTITNLTHIQLRNMLEYSLFEDDSKAPKEKIVLLPTH